MNKVFSFKINKSISYIISLVLFNLSSINLSIAEQMTAQLEPNMGYRTNVPDT